MRYHLFLPTGPEMLTFEAPGYAPRTFAVAVPETGATVSLAWSAADLHLMEDET